mgnify:CR=1 FL=1
MNFEVNPTIIMEDMDLLKSYVEQIQSELSYVTATVNSLVGTAWTSQVATTYQNKINNSIKLSDGFLDNLKQYISSVHRLAEETKADETALANQFNNMQ